MTARAAGLLLHITSLPGRFGIGDLGPQALRFLEWARSAGQRLWQVLPLGPTGPGNSPYGCSSAFAGNPLLISPELLVEEGLLEASSLAEAPAFPPERVDFPRVTRWKEDLLRRSWDRFSRRSGDRAREDLREFAEAPPQSWLADWTLFAAIRARSHGLPWSAWDRGLSRREPESLARASASLADEIAYQQYLQWLFHTQWQGVRREAAGRGIGVIGDVPFYPALDSADVWANQRLFALDVDGAPERVAGVPPDYFSSTGQLWGNPLYRWDEMEEEVFTWWIERLRANLARCDLMRVDHFRAFAAYWAVPAGETTAASGQWVPGPGARLFRAARAALGELPILAEDLGVITPDVRELLSELGLPGMRVLQFAFFEPDSEHLPHRHAVNAVVYTGTHDNDTARGWFERLEAEEKERVLDYLGGSPGSIWWDMIRAAYTSVGERAIVPLQDVLGLDSRARMNTPAEPAGNWAWRAPEGAFAPDVARRLRRLAALTGRGLASEP